LPPARLQVLMNLSFAAYHVIALICLSCYLDLCSFSWGRCWQGATEAFNKLFGPNAWFIYPKTNPALAHAALSWPRLERGRDFQLLAQGSSNHLSIAIFLPSPGTIKLSEEELVTRWSEEIPLVAGAKLLHNVLTAAECDRFIVASESMGYVDHGSKALGGRPPSQENNWKTRRSFSHSAAPSPLQSMWLVDDTLNHAVFERVRLFLPLGALGLNAHWRFYRTDRGVGMARHTDGAWTGSGMRNGIVVRDAFGDRLSQYSIVFYLNDDFKGGDLIFISAAWQRQSVSVPRGGAVLFPHGESSLNTQHEGGQVLFGAKYIFRTDVLYAVGQSATPGGMEPRRPNFSS